MIEPVGAGSNWRGQWHSAWFQIQLGGNRWEIVRGNEAALAMANAMLQATYGSMSTLSQQIAASQRQCCHQMRQRLQLKGSTLLFIALVMTNKN
jgi:hypothetical protein